MFSLFSELNTLISNSDAERKQCLPETIVKITRELYLVCDKLFGAFVNAEGKRLKSTEMLAWPLPPHKIGKNYLMSVHHNEFIIKIQNDTFVTVFLL